MLEIANITQICSVYPSHWEGTTVDGEEIYVCYRWGMLRITINHEIVFEQSMGDDLDGYIEWEEVEDILLEL